jgi:hypothetical protein
MSLVAFGTATLDDAEQSLVLFPEGGVFVATVDGTALGAGQTLTLDVRTRVNQDSADVNHTRKTLAGPAPADPAAAVAGPIVTKEAVEVVAYLSTATPRDCPWKLQHRGRVSTVEGGEGTVTGSAEQTLVTVPYGGTFVLLVDAAAMQAGDDLHLRLKAKGGGPESTEVTVVHELFEDVQVDQVLQVWIDVDEGVEATLHQSAGSGRSFPWSVVKVG